MEKIRELLKYKKRPNLASALKGASYELNPSSTYGSRWHSILTTVEVYCPIQKHDFLSNLSDEDKCEILNAFLAKYPVREGEYELVDIEFFIDPNAPIPSNSREVNQLKTINFDYIHDQIRKCDDKITEGDYEGAITNARTLIESLCLYILEKLNCTESYNGDLPKLYKKTAQKLNMHPEQHAEQALKQILRGFVNIIQGLSAIRNALSDAHGITPSSYRPLERHANLAVSSSKALAEFMYASFVEVDRS